MYFNLFRKLLAKLFLHSEHTEAVKGMNPKGKYIAKKEESVTFLDFTSGLHLDSGFCLEYKFQWSSPKLPSKCEQ